MKSLVQSMVRNALHQLAGIEDSKLTYTTTLSSSYSPSTGTVTDSTDSFQFTGTFGNYSRREVYISQGKLEKNDRPLLITPDQLGDTKPTFGDRITLENGEAWEIVEGGIGLDPAQALYVLQMRQRSAES